MSKKTLFIIIGVFLFIIVLLIGGSKAGWFGKSGNFEKVEVLVIDQLPITETVSAAGKIQPEVEVELSSEVSGEIIELPVVEGQQVKEGDLLIKINPDIYTSMLTQSEASLKNIRAAHAQAQANFEQARLNHERYRTLFEQGVVPQAKWDEVVAAFESAKANLRGAYFNIESAQARVKEANDNLARTSIYAPMDGTISRLNVEVGQRVVGTQQMAGTPLMSVANMGNMEVLVDINENDIVKVSIGDSAIVEVDAYLKKKFKGIVTEISSSAMENLTADQVTNFEVKVRILKSSYADLIKDDSTQVSPFRPGMTATVDVITNDKENVIGVPISAIVIKSDTTSTRNSESKRNFNTDQQFECVFVKKGNQAKLQVVETGIQDSRNIEILSGLHVGDTVITGPYSTVTKTLDDGDKIEIVKKTATK